MPTVAPSGVAAAGGGGLLLALIDVGIEANRMAAANKLVEPIRKEIADFDFRTRFFESLKKTAPALATIKTKRVTTVLKAPSGDEVSALRRQMAETELLVLTSAYVLSADFKAVTVTTRAELWFRDQDEPIFRGQYQ